MMKKDYELSNVSFTNKDFFDVYPELLQLAKKLSAKWDPTVSNESDPGVVLIKELALITDKINYISDKYALENNPRSVTQIENARQLYNLLGYYPRWYESAKVNLSLYWNGEPERNKYITIPKYTGFQDPDGEFIYTCLEDILLPLDGSLASGNVEAIEGTYHRLVVNNSDIITLSMLSDDQRIYINNYNVAQNGIFITDSTGTVPWVRVNNINLVQDYSNCYSFNTDIVTGQCYIQFPQEIPYLIGDGLIINYVVSKGKYGNMPINTLTKLVASSLKTQDTDGFEKVIDTGEIVVTNSGSTYLGKDPETIDEMYQSWKKIAGTFDTLVTLRDYNNASRRYPDYASNAFVCDRTNDVQLCYKVISGTPSMPTERVKIERYPEGSKDKYDKDISGENKLQPYDLKLYGLRSFPYETIDRYSYYDNTFQLFSDVEMDITDSSYKKLVDAISTHQCISHNFEKLEPGKICMLKNKYNIDLQILPTTELTSIQSINLKSNICKAIYSYFNANKVEFGEKIDYDDLLECIQNSDNRIKTAVLSRLVYDTYAVFYQDVGYVQWIETPVSDDAYLNMDWENSYSEPWIRNLAQEKAAEFRTEIVAKNILAGITPYIVDDGFDFPYSFDTYAELNNQEASHISTNLYIPLNFTSTKRSVPVKLGENEVISFSKPNLLDIRSYGAYVYYEYKGPGVNAKEDHILTSEESICFFYKEAEDDTKYRFDLYGPGTIIRSTTDLSDNSRDIIASVFGSSLPELPGQCITAYMGLASVRQYTGLSVKDSIVVKRVNKVLLGNPESYIYFVTNKVKEGQYWLEFNKDNKRVLEEGEYFVYTNATKTSLEILGAGTELRWVDPKKAQTLTCEYIEVSDISMFGATVLNNKWYTLTAPLEVLEKSFTNALEGDELSFTLGGTYEAPKTIIIDSSGVHSPNDLFKCDYKSETLPGAIRGIAFTPRSFEQNQKLFLEMMHRQTFDHNISEEQVNLEGIKIREISEDDSGVAWRDLYAWKSTGLDGQNYYIYDYTSYKQLFCVDGSNDVDPDKLAAYMEALGIDSATSQTAQTSLLTTISDMSATPPSSGASSGGSIHYDGYQPTEEEIEAFLAWYYNYTRSQGQFLYLQQFVTYPDNDRLPEIISGADITGTYSYTPKGESIPLSSFSKITINGEPVDTTTSLDIATDCNAFFNIDTTVDRPQVVRYDPTSGITDQVFFYLNNLEKPIKSLNGDISGNKATYHLYSSHPVYVTGGMEPKSVQLLDEHLEEFNPTFYAIRRVASRKDGDVDLYSTIGNYTYINFGAAASGSNKQVFANSINLPAGDYILSLAHSNNCLSNLTVAYKEGSSTKLLKKMGTNITNLAEPGNYYLTFSTNGGDANLQYSYSLRDTASKTKSDIEGLTNYKYGYVYKMGEAVSNEFINVKVGEYIIAKKDYVATTPPVSALDKWRDFGVTPTPISSLVISDMMKYTYNDQIQADQGLLQKIESLDYDNEFNYLYDIPEKNMIVNPLVAESFFNKNHVYNPFTIAEAKKPEILA